MRHIIVTAFLVAAAAIGGTTPAWSQSSVPALGTTQRDCQTIRTCRFERGGSYRGCLSSYTCRVCRPVRTKCEIGGRMQNCHELRCTWGG